MEKTKILFSNIEVFYRVFSNHELNRKSCAYIAVNGLEKCIYRYTNLANINKFLSTKM